MARMVQEVSVAGGIRRPPTSLGARLLAILAAMLAGAAVWAMATAPALSQDDTGATSYITPFPENDIYRLQVLGDWMAEGLLAALTEGFADDARLQLPKRQQTVAGLIRLEAQEFQGLEDAIAREPMHIAVMLFGVGDRIPLRGPGNRRVPIGSEEWRAEYGRRVDRLVRALKRRGAAVYLVSLPIVRRSDMNDDVQMLNEVFRERALLNNVKFIDVYEAFADESGSYNQYGPDLTGKIRLLRDGDGVGLTAVGSRKLAYFVEREIKRDLTQARNERTIPLAGAEAEQRRILPKPQAAPPGWGGTATPAPKGAKEAGSKVAGQGASHPPPGSGELKADSGKAVIKSIGRTGREETISVEILRPAIPASVVALMTRRESPDRPSQHGDVLSETLPGGTMVLNSITPGLASGSAGQRQRLAPTQSPFFRVLVKGERLTPKAGRADDFRWPRPDADATAAEEVRPVQPRPSAMPAVPAPRS